MSETRQTHRWRGVTAVALVAGAIGLFTARSPLLLLSAAGVVFAAYPELSKDPTPSVELERTVSDTSPSRGDEVDVTVTVRNAGDWPLFDLRVVDGVPAGLGVVDGVPRHGTSLWPGHSTTFSYTVQSAIGTHGFEPATVVTRDLPGATEVETTVAASEETVLACSTPLEEGPVRSQTLPASGRIPATSGESGIQFDRTREYQTGDSLRQVDWNRYARTGRLTTVEFREERATSVLLLVDARETAYRGPEGEPHAVTASVSAAERIAAGLFAEQNQVGVAAFSPDPCWLSPGRGPDHRTRVRKQFAGHAAFGATPPPGEADVDEQLRTLRARLSQGTQVVLFSPLCDDDVVRAARRLDGGGHRVTVFTPDPTDEGSTGRDLARVERANRVSRLRGAGLPVVEWEADEPLETALETAQRRWSQ